MFQNTIVKKYLNAQTDISEKWEVFKNHFHNAEIQENIRNAKEEQYQGEFLIDLFVNILGYTKNPTPNFNLTTELKNVKDSKKADGAIIINENVRGVIELKGTNTTDLSKVEPQAFGYKNNQVGCTYVIISNFEKLRFYIDNAIEHIEFNLFTLTKSEFEILYLCLALENISKDIPKKIKNDSVSEEDIITKKLYNDYSLFKRELFSDLCEKNPNYNPLDLFKKSQKLLDRFLFLFFAEDKTLLPPNSIREIIKQWEKLKELDAYSPLYSRFKKFFGYMNTGFSGTKYDIFAYNGGLFKPDEILDNIVIDDEILHKHTLKLSEYDFDSEVDVNILGHIFENSLNELDEVKAQLNGEEIDKSKTKRKKDGVFYTPKYITKYIVENTVGKLCSDKKIEFAIEEELYTNDKRKTKAKKKELKEKLDQYRKWLLQLTIIDPACGSGAFLNEALNFLIAEHTYIDELENKLLGGGFTFPNIENSILENNLFGVDLNEESVEIAKLSLWLRTAQPNRKLNSLNNNIKCGNSLIDDKDIAGDKAFDWQQEFPQIFEKGGFDVVIGNPPYVVVKSSKDYKNYEWSSDLYLMFYELIFKKSILKNKGLFGFITPRFFAVNKNCKNIRKFLLKEIEVIKIVETSPFEDANTECLITIAINKELKNDDIKIYEDTDKEIKKINTISKKYCLQNENYEIQNFLTQPKIDILKRIELETKKLNQISESKRGMEIGKRDFDEDGIKTLVGYDTKKYKISFDNKFVSEDHNQFKRLKDFFKKTEMILLRRVSKDLVASIIENDFFSFNKNLYGIHITDKILKSKYVLVLLNSKVLNFYYKNKFTTKKVDLFPEIQSYLFKSLPIKQTSKENQQPFIEKADLILALNKDLQQVSSKFTRTLQRKFEGLEKLPKKLESWYVLSFGDFVKELKKKKIKLSLSEESEWEDYFLAEQEKAMNLQTQIRQTDNAIDKMIYDLYDLTDEEIKIVENQ